MIYLDHSATTPVDSRVFEAMKPYLTEHYGNPSSIYRAGQDVRKAVREDIDTYGRFHGGLIARGEIAGDVPLENVEAMLDEMTRYGGSLLSPA